MIISLWFGVLSASHNWDGGGGVMECLIALVAFRPPTTPIISTAAFSL